MAVDIPVIGNGDVRAVAEIQSMKIHTGCPAVMIARGAIGNPWIFAGLDRHKVSHEEVRDTMVRHLDRMLAFYGSAHGLILFRKHANRYLSPYRLPPMLQKRLLTSQDPMDFVDLLTDIIAWESPA